MIAKMYFKRFISASLFLAIFLPILCVYAESPAQSDTGVNVDLSVFGCNNNGICEAGLGEDAINCSLDCSEIPIPPVTPPTGGSTSGGYHFGSSLVITNLSISSDQNSAIINWSGNNTALSVFSWGATADYEIGSVSDVFFITNHRVSIKNLTAGTNYYFKINARDLYGHTLNYFGNFTTLSFPQLSVLPNVQDLIITYPSNEVTLTWINPRATDFAGVVVVRSPYAYPRDPADGKIIYEGQGNYVTDLSAQQNTVYYYSVFVYDSKINYSSGSIAKSVVRPVKPTSPTLPTTPSSTFVLKLSDFDFIQDGRSLVFQNSPVGVSADKNLTVSISALKLPASLRFGTMQVGDQTEGHSSTYLFSFNKALGAYEAQVNLFRMPGGMYPFAIDLQTATSGEAVFAGTFEVSKSAGVLDGFGVFGWQSVIGIFWVIVTLIIVLILLILIGLVLYRIIRRFLSNKN